METNDSGGTGNKKKRSSTKDASQAKLVAYFEVLISVCTGYGAAYNPANPAISIANLHALLLAADAELQNTRTFKVAHDNTINARKLVFQDLRKLGTRISGAMKSAGLPQEIIDDVLGIQRKMYGRRSAKTAKEIREENEQQKGTEGGDQKKHNSVSHQGHDDLAVHFADMITTVSAQLLYVPNEPELQVPALQQKLGDLKTANTAVVNAQTAWENAMAARDKVLYNDTTGIVAIAFLVRNYIRSLYDFSSPQYAQLKGLYFKKKKV